MWTEIGLYVLVSLFFYVGYVDYKIRYWYSDWGYDPERGFHNRTPPPEAPTSEYKLWKYTQRTYEVIFVTLMILAALLGHDSS